MSNEQLLKQVREAIEEHGDRVMQYEIIMKGEDLGNDELYKSIVTSLLALRFMEKMLGEPSEGIKYKMVTAFQDNRTLEDARKAMVNEVLEELEE